VNIQDGVDIAYAYGRQGSTISYVIANTLLNSVYSKADYFVDIHGGDLLEEYYPNCEFVRVGNPEIDRQSELLARTFGTEIIREHTLPVDELKIGKLALNIPQIAVEIGCCGRLDEASVTVAVRGISNIMKQLGMIDGEPVMPGNQTLWENAGLFYPKVKVGDTINHGQILGVIKNLQGQLIEELIAPHDGMITLMMHNPVKLPGDLVFKCLKP
jgi:predicted deacylase